MECQEASNFSFVCCLTAECTQGISKSSHLLLDDLPVVMNLWRSKLGCTAYHICQRKAMHGDRFEAVNFRVEEILRKVMWQQSVNELMDKHA